jgi:hypothetical protein
MIDIESNSQRTAAARAGFSARNARHFNVDKLVPSQRKIV